MVEDKELTKKAKELKAEYMREYRKRPGNKERQAEYQARYWNRKAEQEQNK